MQNKYKIFTKKLANILCKKGFILLGVEVNNKKPWLYVYLFEDTDKLREFVQDYIGGKYE
jgi:hypothetical protein